MSKMISGTTSSFPNIVSSPGLQMYGGLTQDFPSLEAASSGLDTHSNFFLYSLSILKEKVHQTQSMISILVCPDQNHPEAESTTATAIARMGTLLQEIVGTASSMLFTSQQMALGSTTTLATNNTNGLPESSGFSQHNFDSVENYVSTQVIEVGEERVPQGCFYSDETLDWYRDDNGTDQVGRLGNLPQTLDQGNEEASQALSPKNHEIIEPDAADLLAKYTHYCRVCGKGFKRDANLRMHMRAHGDEYKSSEALINPMKKEDRISTGAAMKLERKYSCPQDGCRWNRNHPKFQPLKSMICAKNHYKRSHCPKVYVCKRCGRKQFSVVSDLRTHEKHCGSDRRWRCSCGTTFARKDKLVGHVALFAGHTPAVNSSTEVGKF